MRNSEIRQGFWARRTSAVAAATTLGIAGVLGLTSCLEVDEKAESNGPIWDGPTDGVWGTDISPAAFLLGFKETWDIDWDFTIAVQDIPQFGTLEGGLVPVTGLFTVTRTQESNDSPDRHFGWTAGNDEPSETGNHLRLDCDNEDLQVGESTTCRGSFRAKPEQIPNMSWRFAMHDAAAWPGQTLESAPK